MTREEAIRKINAIKKYLTAGNPIWDVREIDVALNMAIKALEIAFKEIRGWEEIIIETKDGELIVDITAENYIAKDGYSIRLVPCEDKNL